MRKLKCVFWDVDGTLADTEMYGHRIAFNNAFSLRQLNWRWDITTYAQLLKIQGGVNRIKFYANSIGIDIDNKLLLDLHLNKQIYYKKQIESGKVPLRKGVKRLVKELHSANIMQIIVTSSSLHAVKSLLVNKFNEMGTIFYGAITYENVVNHKPSPEAYLKALKLSGCKAHSCIAIEDSMAGLESSSKASIKCLLTLPPWQQNDFSNMKNAKVIINHLGESNDNCSFFHGMPCIKGKITLDYLESLLN